MGKNASQKKSESVSEWKCPENCPVGPEPCKHLEKLLPRLRPFYWKELNERVAAPPKSERSMTEEKIAVFERILEKYKLSDEARALLRARFVDGKEWREIMREQGFVNRMTMHRYFKRVLDDLKSRGFAPRKKQ